MDIRRARYELLTMDVGIELIGLLLLVWLVGDAVIVVIAVVGAGARSRRSARASAVRHRRRVPVATLRPGAVGRRSPHGVRRRGAARLR